MGGQGGAARRAVLALGDSETTDEVLGASEPEIGMDLDDGRDHDEDIDALHDIMGARSTPRSNMRNSTNPTRKILYLY